MTPKLLVRDVSEFCDLPDGLEKIEYVYIFDDSVRVHLCSLASYIGCEYIYTVLHFADDLDDETREQFYEDYDYSACEYEYFSPDHSGIIDLKDDGEGYDDWEDVVECYTCNHAY